MAECDLDKPQHLWHSAQKTTLSLTFYTSAVFTGGKSFKYNLFFTLEKPKANFKSKKYSTDENHVGRESTV